MTAIVSMALGIEKIPTSTTFSTPSFFEQQQQNQQIAETEPSTGEESEEATDGEGDASVRQTFIFTPSPLPLPTY